MSSWMGIFFVLLLQGLTLARHTLSCMSYASSHLDVIFCAWYLSHAYFAFMSNTATKTLKNVSLYFYSFMSLKSI
jgi:hypothetical protein